MGNEQQHTSPTARSLGIIRPPLVVCWITFLAVAAFAPQLMAQAENKWVSRGDAAYLTGDYMRAIEYYSWAERKAGNWKASLDIATCYRALMDYEHARDYYAKVVRQPGVPIETYFYYGQSLMTTRNYVEAERWFAKYATAAPNDPRAVVFHDLDRLVAAVMRDSAQYEVKRLPINSKWSDFSPAFYQGGLLFVSARPNEVGILHTSTVNDAPLLDLYFTAPDSSGHWSRPKPFSALNSKLNEGPLVVDTASGTVFLTRNDPAHRKHRDKTARNGLNRLQIEAYFIEKEGLRPCGPLPFNHPRYAVGHPAVSPDGRQLLFASDMPGGFGGTDLYLSQWQDGAWGPARNLGAMVNSPEDELFPFMDAAGQLYFASNGHMGLGGLDIFYVPRTSSGEWARVQNLGFPINSEADDFGLILDPSGNGGYFSSNRNADPTDDNVYAFKRYWPRFECAPQIKNSYCFEFWESGVIDADSVPLAYEWNFGDGYKARGLVTHHCYDGPGTYHVELNLIDTLLNFLFLNQTEYELVVQDTEQVYIDCPDRIGVGQAFEVNAEKSVHQGCAIEKYFWEMGDGFRETASRFIHSYDLPGTYEIRLGVTGSPNEAGDLVCKTCITKTVEVMPLTELKLHLDSVQTARQQRLDAQSQWKHPALVENLLDVGEKIYDLRDSAQKGQYSVKLMRTTEPIDPRSAAFKGIRDLREVRTAQGYEIYSGLEDSLERIRPYFVEAHEQGFDDAVVVVVRDSLAEAGRPKRSFKIPAKKTDTGYTLFAGEVRDPSGQPLQAEITFEDLEKGLEVFRAKADSLGRVKFHLPNGNVYIWNATLQDYFPVSGYLDLLAASEAPSGVFTFREKITLREISELMASGEPIRVNNIFFDFDSDRIRPESKRQLDQLGSLLVEYPDFGVVVMAHTDDWGNDHYNMDLSRRRASSVVRYLIMVGYDVSKIRWEGHGESKPAVPNDTAAHRQFNRRVEFRFYPLKHP